MVAASSSSPAFMTGQRKQPGDCMVKLQRLSRLRSHFSFCSRVQRSHCRKIEPVRFGVNSHTRTCSPNTDAGEESHGHKLVAQTDYSHIQLGERRELKIQSPHFRYPKLLFLPKPFSVTGAP